MITYLVVLPSIWFGNANLWETSSREVCVFSLCELAPAGLRRPVSSLCCSLTVRCVLRPLPPFCLPFVFVNSRAVTRDVCWRCLSCSLRRIPCRRLSRSTCSKCVARPRLWGVSPVCVCCYTSRPSSDKPSRYGHRF
jgi:hypothetical protein